MTGLLPLMLVPLLVWVAVWTYLWTLDGKVKRLEQQVGRLGLPEEDSE